MALCWCGGKREAEVGTLGEVGAEEETKKVSIDGSCGRGLAGYGEGRRNQNPVSLLPEGETGDPQQKLASSTYN